MPQPADHPSPDRFQSEGPLAESGEYEGSNGKRSSDMPASQPANDEAATPTAKPQQKPIARPVAKAVAKPARSKSTTAPPVEAAVALPEDMAQGEKPTRRRFFSESPSWLTSLMVHLLVIIGLAVWTLPDLPQITANLLLAEPSDNEDLDDFQDMPDLSLDPADVETEPVEFELQPDTNVISDAVSLSEFDDLSAAPSFVSLTDLALNSAMSSLPTDAPGFDGTGTTGRGRRARTSLVRKHGGSSASETSVALALDWLAEHQNPDGSWSLIHDGHRCQGRCPNAASLGPDKQKAYRDSRISGTGLALLPYLGAGQTHKEGKHKKVVAAGLAALVQLAKEAKTGASWMDSGNMYSHGIAAICLTEAYGMTKDASLRGPAQAAVDFIAYAQHKKGGGWRYRVNQEGDTSVTGWQIMALKSAYLSKLSVNPQVVAKASLFLDQIGSDDGARYGYGIFAGDDAEAKKSHRNATRTRSAIGLLCRMYLGWKNDNPALIRGIGILSKRGPSRNNFYYNYYASQVIFQYTGGKGTMWRDWNKKLRDQLVAQQTKSGHAKGSWYVEGPHSTRGGRLYITSLAAMNLEVYYRYMPIYGTDAVTSEFPE